MYIIYYIYIIYIIYIIYTYNIYIYYCFAGKFKTADEWPLIFGSYSYNYPKVTLPSDTVILTWACLSTGECSCIVKKKMSVRECSTSGFVSCPFWNWKNRTSGEENDWWFQIMWFLSSGPNSVLLLTLNPIRNRLDRSWDSGTWNHRENTSTRFCHNVQSESSSEFRINRCWSMSHWAGWDMLPLVLVLD